VELINPELSSTYPHQFGGYELTAEKAINGDLSLNNFSHA